MHEPLFRLDGRTAAVTGWRGRLGGVWVESLLGAGASVAGIDLEVGAETIRPRFLALRADVRDRASLETARERVERELGPVSILINNAGLDQPPGGDASTWRLEDVPAESCREILDVNLVGLFQAAQAFGRGMVERRGGSIINIGSLYAAVSPDPRLYDHLPVDPPFLKPPMYGASKAAVVNLTRYLAAHWGPFGVRVNALSPGGILGGQDAEFRRKFGERVPLRRLGEPADLAGPMLFLASEASRYVTGIELRVDGGYTAW
jgi:NAD(P)-dependent dehydrogenase (short-subunit alcohol dehydrogenase family)